MEIGRTLGHTSNSTSIQQPKSGQKPRLEFSDQGNNQQPKELKEEVKNIKKADVTEVQKKIEGVNQFLKAANTDLKFNLHESLNEYYITIVDEETNKVVREIPPKKLLDFYAAMMDTLGLFIDKKI